VSHQSQIRVLLALLLAAGAVAGCSGGGDSSTESPPPPPPANTTTRLSNVGCDSVDQCLPQLAQATLDRCPVARLSLRGREARRRLERLLARITSVDLHNEQAYEATDAVRTTLTDLEQACLPRG
jgi:hypothetical protein